jgi:hypothetical protein
MTKFDDFLNDELPEINPDDEQLDGNYGCQTCEKHTLIAHFNEKQLEIYWFCPEGHRSSIRLG